MKLAAGFFIIPVMMTYSSLLFLDGVSLWEGVASIGLTLALIGCVTVMVEGYALARLRTIERLGFMLAAAMIVYPDTTSRLALGTLTVHWTRLRAHPPAKVPTILEDDDE
ncbi:MAG TPA: hypothetical protein VLK65_08410 [Vicinamibacteria bacterium]|nr:hypothetical protein [Vicinamibacteria bacterium]